MLTLLIVTGLWIFLPQRTDAATWKPEYSGSPSTLNGVVGVASNIIFTVDSLGSIFRYDGLYWNGMVNLSGYFYHDIWASSPSDIYVVGDGGRLIHYDGSSWTLVETGADTSFKGVWGSSPSDVFAVGGRGTVYHFNGVVWEEMTIPNPMSVLSCVWGSGPNDVYAVGWEVFHYDGTSWSKILQDYSLEQNFYSVWGSATNDVFIGAEEGAIFHFNGTNWLQMDTGTEVAIKDIWGTTANNVYAVGAGGVIIRYNGNAWNAVVSGTDKDLESIWGSSANDIVVAGDEGTIYHYKNWPTAYKLSLAETGQTQGDYPGDDGDLQAGLDWPDPRFTDNGDGTVTDNLTHLMWMKDANIGQTIHDWFPWLPSDGSMMWQDALDCVAGVNEGSIAGGTGYSDWRLPSAAEIESVFNAAPCSVGMWLMDMGYFDNVSYRYWTSTTYRLSTDMAWVGYLGDYNFCQSGIRYMKKDNFYHVWYVRGESNGPAPIRKTGQTISYSPGDDGDIQAGIDWPEPRFIDNGDGTVTDRLAGLMWLKDARCFGRLSWTEALDSIDSLNNNPEANDCMEYTENHDDWRMPNRRELLSLLDYSRTYPTLPREYFRYFPNVDAGGWSGTYWTSTSLEWCNRPDAFTVSLQDGRHWFWEKTMDWYVWPVRTAPRFTIVKPYPDISILGQWPFAIVGRLLTFDATRSYATSLLNPIVSYQWDLDGDGVYGDATGPVIDHAWEAAGTYDIGLKITDSRGAIALKSVSITIAGAEPLEVILDIKPGSRKNPLNKKSKGVLRAVVFGTEYFDVSTVDAASIALQGIHPVKMKIRRVSAADKKKRSKIGMVGHYKLVLKFSAQKILNALKPRPIGSQKKGSKVTLTLTGNLKAENGGIQIHATDIITLK